MQKAATRSARRDGPNEKENEKKKENGVGRKNESGRRVRAGLFPCPPKSVQFVPDTASAAQHPAARPHSVPAQSISRRFASRFWPVSPPVRLACPRRWCLLREGELQFEKVHAVVWCLNTTASEQTMTSATRLCCFAIVLFCSAKHIRAGCLFSSDFLNSDFKSNLDSSSELGSYGDEDEPRLKGYGCPLYPEKCWEHCAKLKRFQATCGGILQMTCVC
ncbi:uncharacterized protein [Dermacentor albipictus]|uniref:uncharacterized protein n=1 Tax=Dermacentor albipictus TaxID=60249 RepID=UPI0031FD8573